MASAKRVLVVDDYPAVVLALRVALEPDGRFVIGDIATTAAQGLDKLPGHDVVLLDLHLPDMEGKPMVEAYRQRAPDVPIVLHSADDDTPEVEAVRPLVDAVAPKGRNAEVLDALVRATRTER